MHDEPHYVPAWWDDHITRPLRFVSYTLTNPRGGQQAVVILADADGFWLRRVWPARIRTDNEGR